MSTKIKSLAVVSIRVLLGLIYFVFGLNFFLHFLPTPPLPAGPAGTFVGGLFQSGYFFPLLKGIEVVLGAALLTRLFVPLALVMLMPISMNIFLFHAFLDPSNMVISLTIIIFNLYLLWAHREFYKPLLHRKSTVSF